MFLQVFQGRVGDAAAVKRCLDDWADRLAPSAEGWLGSTAGVTDDGMFIGVARFESTEAARRNSDRLEQGEWWVGLAKEFTGEVTFHDCSEVLTMRSGGSDEARFVQVIQGRATDPARMRRLGDEAEQALGDYRPEMLGSVVGLHNAGDGGFTQLAYFTDEDSARRGEQEPPPVEVRETLAEMTALMADVVYHDLRSPWMMSPR